MTDPPKGTGPGVYTVTDTFGTRLPAVPFWIVERAREPNAQRGETGARRNKREETGGKRERKGLRS